MSIWHLAWGGFVVTFHVRIFDLFTRVFGLVSHDEQVGFSLVPRTAPVTPWESLGIFGQQCFCTLGEVPPGKQCHLSAANQSERITVPPLRRGYLPLTARLATGATEGAPS